MDEPTSLDEILSGAAVEQDEPETAPEPTPEPTGAVDTPPVSEPERKPPEGMVPVGALADERAKRQELQRQVEELRRAQEKPKQDEPEVDFLDDPDKWKEQLSKRHQSELEGLRREFQQTRLADSEEAARARYKDADVKFDDALAAFGQAVQQNHALAQEMLNARNPGDYAYNAGRRLLMLAEADGDLETLIQRREQAAVAKALAERQEAVTAKVANIPESLSKVTGATTSAKKDDAEFVPLAKLLLNKDS